MGAFHPIRQLVSLVLCSTLAVLIGLFSVARAASMNHLVVTLLWVTTLLMLVRTVVATAWMCMWPLASIYLMNWAWQAIDLPLAQWLAVVGPLALLTPALALMIPTLATDKVAALAVFKAQSSITLFPLGLHFVPDDAPSRLLFLLSPTGWIVEAYLGFLDPAVSGYRWALGGTVYAVVLLAGVVYFFRRNVYKSYH